MADRQEPTQAAAGDGPPRRPVLAGVLWLCLLAAGVFAAWQAHQAWFAPVRAPVQVARLDSSLPASGPAWGSLDLRQLLEGPMSAVGVARMTGDPLDLSPPPGAQQVSAFQWVAADTIHQQAEYRFEGALDQAAEHYCRRASYLRAVDPASLGNVKPAQDMRVLIGATAGRRVIVVLRADRLAERIVTIAVTALLDARQ